MESSRPLTDPEFDSLVAVGHDVLISVAIPELKAQNDFGRPQARKK